jgi:DNA invertase Pin-like site-specific DNA recombinase
MIYGYARVSTDGQSLDAQVKQLRAAGAEKVFRETASGAKTDRVQLRRLIGKLENGDVLMVTRLDRLARSTRPTGQQINTDRPPPFGVTTWLSERICLDRSRHG